MAATTPERTEVTTPSDVEVQIVRVLDGSRELVWEALTRPEHVSSWLLGPPGWTMPVCEIDLRPGGAWHYEWRNDNGDEMEMNGVYRELAPPERIINTENWGGEYPETINSVTLTELADGRTRLTTVVRYPSQEARDAALQTGMEKGVDLSYDRLERLLRSLALER